VKRYAVFAGWLIATLLLSSCGVRKGNPEMRAVAPQGGDEPTVPPPTALPASDVILVDGELVNVYPPLELSFPGGASGELLALYVRVGQQVKEGDLIATMDDSELQKTVGEAQIELERGVEDKRKGEADAEKTYQREKGDAEERYQREKEKAEKKYRYDREDALRAIETAQRDLERARMQPPTTGVAEAEANVARAHDQEAQAADDYKQALDRPWENQRIRDSLHKEWQVRIKDRELAQLRLQDAQVALAVYYVDLEAKEEDVEKARADLARVEIDFVKKDYVEKEVSLTYDRAVADAERKLAEAQQAFKDARLYAPRDGLVLSIETNVGATVGSGTAVVTLLNVKDRYFVTDNLSERHVARLRKGQQANVTLRTYPDTVVTGQVEVVLPQLERKTDADAHFAAYIRLGATELDLLPGMTGRVEIVTEEK